MLKKISIGEGGTLERIRMEDAIELFRVVDKNRAHLRKWLPWVDMTAAINDSEIFIQSCLKQERDSDGFQCVIRQDDRLAGLIGFHHHNRMHHQTSIGYWLSAEHEGKGLVSRACERLLEYCFLDWLVHRVEIRCGVGNQRSAAIPKKLGFRLEGVARDAEWLYDRFINLEVYSILKPEWETRRNPSPRN